VSRKLIFSTLALTILLITGLSCDSGLNITARPGTEAHMELTKPSITKWAYEIKTSTYTYLTLYLTKDSSGAYILKTFYVYEKDKWVFHKDTITLDPKIYGEIIIHKAPAYEIK